MTTRSLSVSDVVDSASAAITCARRLLMTPFERAERVNAERLLHDKCDNSVMIGSMTERRDVIAGRRRRGELSNDNS